MRKVNRDYSKSKYNYKISGLSALLIYKVLGWKEFSKRIGNFLFLRWCHENTIHTIITTKKKGFRADITIL